MLVQPAVGLDSKNAPLRSKDKKIENAERDRTPWWHHYTFNSELTKYNISGWTSCTWPRE